MRFWNLIRYVLISGAAGALFAGCGGSQLPVAAPNAMAQGSALAARTNTKNFRVVYDFGPPPDGNYPVGSLIEMKGTLYGTTVFGGTRPACTGDQGGTVFSLTPSGTENVLHSFDGHTDGCNPSAGLIDVGGKLYGTTGGGGLDLCGYYSQDNTCGTVFSITSGGKEKVVHYFGECCTDGNWPTAPLVDVKGTLYGTTTEGGPHYCEGYPYHCGTVFSVTTSGTEKVLYSFSPAPDGFRPQAGLIDAGGKLYGTTQLGGDNSCGYSGCGTVFSVTMGGKEKVLHTFGHGSDGRYPNAGLIEVKGTFYGTTRSGGSCNLYAGGCGTVFSVTADGTEKVLHSFNGADGLWPQASLIDVKSTLYGTTSGGGTGGAGTVFSISTAGKEKVLHSFASGPDGSAPYASLLNVKGTLYGTTSQGGANSYYCYGGASGPNGCGTVFALTP